MIHSPLGSDFVLGGTHILAGATVGIVVAEVTLLGTFSPVAYSLAVVGGVIGGQQVSRS